MRTRNAADLRSFTTQKDDLVRQITHLEQERDSEKVAYDNRLKQMNEEIKDRE